MITIPAAQVIYTRVEPSYSPENKGGWGIVYKSEGLSQNLLQVIEKRVQCFKADEQNPHRHQFFLVSKEKLVIAKSSRIESDKKIIDKAGRPGAFIAHCLVLRHSDFNKIHNNPFLIFENFDFISAPQIMVERLGKATGIAPIIEISITNKQRYRNILWSGHEALRLIELGFQSKEILGNAQSVRFIGNSQDNWKTLKVLFALLPTKNRFFCSFDTNSDGCKEEPGIYWALGAISKPRLAYWAVVNSSKRSVSKLDKRIDYKKPYKKWLKHTCLNNDLNKAVKLSNSMQIISQAYENKASYKNENVTDKACVEFLRLNKKEVSERLINCIENLIGKERASEVAQYLCSTGPINCRNLLNIAASGTISNQALSYIILDWINKTNPKLNRRDFKALKALAKRSENMELLHYAATAGESVHGRARDTALKRMNSKQYKNSLRFLLNPVSPVDFIIPKYIEILFDEIQNSSQMTNDEFLKFVEKLVEINKGNRLNSLSLYIKNLSNKELTKIENIINNKNNIHTRFLQEVSLRRSQLGSPAGLLSFLRRD
jgi:hypothetical protein